MTNELEKQFFDTFGIEQKTIIESRYSLNTEYYEEKVEKYPQITDRILLELICILTKNDEYGYFGRFENIKDMKDFTLREFIADERYFKHQVRTLFEGGVR